MICTVWGMYMCRDREAYIHEFGGPYTLQHAVTQLHSLPIIAVEVSHLTTNTAEVICDTSLHQYGGPSMLVS